MKDEPTLAGLPDLTLDSQQADSQARAVDRETLKPRFEFINREQMVLRSINVEQLVDDDHSVRAIWEFVGLLDLSGFCGGIRVMEGERGRPTYNPRLMISLWIYANSTGVNSARQIARLCEYDPAYQWLSGMKVVNYHSLSDFRVDHGEALNKLFVQILAVLSSKGLISLERVMQDGTKIKARASSRSFKKKEQIEQHLEMAREHMKDLEAQTDEEMGKSVVKARQRAARQKQQRLESALEEFKKLGSRKTRKKKEYRVSEVEPEARNMKHADGGYAPSYNLQLSTDRWRGMIVGIGISQEATDYSELIPAVDRLKKKLGRLPEQMVTDGGYTTSNNIHQMKERGIDFIAPLTDQENQLKQKGIDPSFSREAFAYDELTNSYSCPAGKTLSYLGKEQRGSLRFRYRASAADCQACPFKQQCCPKSTRRSVMRLEYEQEVASHREKMQTDEAKQIYKQRGQTAEFPNAWIKDKLGVRRFRLRGLTKVGLEAIWACATYNIQQWIRLCWTPRLMEVNT